jgi:hypothetical protein
MDFCLRFDMPSGALPVDLGFDFGLLAPEDFEGPDLPFGDLPLVEGFDAAILAARRVCG